MKATGLFLKSGCLWKLLSRNKVLNNHFLKSLHDQPYAIFFNFLEISQYSQESICIRVSSEQLFSCEYCEVFTNNFFYRTPTVTSLHLLFLIKNNVGWFLVEMLADLIRVSYLHIIRRNHSNKLLLINLQKSKVFAK